MHKEQSLVINTTTAYYALVCSVLFGIRVGRIDVGQFFEDSITHAVFDGLLGIEPLVAVAVLLDRSHVFFYDMEQMKRLLYQSEFDVIDIQGGPWIRYDLPFISVASP